MSTNDTRANLSVTMSALGMPIRTAIDQIARAAIPAVQIDALDKETAPKQLGLSARRDLQATLRRRELAVSGVDCFLPARAFTSAEEVDRAVAMTIEAIRMASHLGRVPVSCSFPRPDADVIDRGGILAAVDQCAQQCGVFVADHTLHGQPAPAAAMIGMGIDPVSVVLANIDLAGYAGAVSGRLVSARLSDITDGGMRVPIPDGGRINVTSYAVALEISGYKQPVVIDTRQWSQPLAGLVQTAEAWRQVVQMGLR